MEKIGKAAEINETYLINKFVSLDDSKLKLKQTDNNTKAFKYLLKDFFWHGDSPHNTQRVLLLGLGFLGSELHGRVEEIYPEQDKKEF